MLRERLPLIVPFVLVILAAFAARVLWTRWRGQP